MRKALEVELHSHLHLSRLVGLGGDISEGSITDVGVWPRELHAVECVENLQPHLQARTFPKLQRQAFEQGRTEIVGSWNACVRQNPRGVAIRVRRGLHSHLRISEILIQVAGSSHLERSE